MLADASKAMPKRCRSKIRARGSQRNIIIKVQEARPMSGSASQGRNQRMLIYGLTFEDAESALPKDGLPHVQRLVIPMRDLDSPIYLHEVASTDTVAISDRPLTTWRWLAAKLERGRWFAATRRMLSQPASWPCSARTSGRSALFTYSRAAGQHRPHRQQACSPSSASCIRPRARPTSARPPRSDQRGLHPHERPSASAYGDRNVKRTGPAVMEIEKVDLHELLVQHEGSRASSGRRAKADQGDARRSTTDQEDYTPGRSLEAPAGAGQEGRQGALEDPVRHHRRHLACSWVASAS